MKEVFLTREIENENTGYVDEVVRNIKSVPNNEELHLLDTCVGGDTMQGDRIYRAIEEHGGKTTAVVIGYAVSMGASILPAFDSVDLDPEAKLMFHTARPKDGSKDFTETEAMLVDDFNKKTAKRMLDKGINADFVQKVFFDEPGEDHWLTAKEAQDLGIGKISPVDKEKRKDQFAIAAKLDMSKFKNENSMKLFAKAVPRVINLSDGRQAIFNSKKEELAVGDTLTLVGSDEKLTGKIQLENNLLAELSGTAEVVNVEEVPVTENVVTDEAFAQLSEAVQSLAGEVQGIMEWKTEMMGAEEGATEEQAIEAKQREEIAASHKEILDKTDKATEMLAKTQDTLENVLKMTASIKTTAKLDPIEDKREELNSPSARLSPGQAQRQRFREIQENAEYSENKFREFQKNRKIRK